MAGRGRLKAAVYVQDPTTREELILEPGECPEPELAVLITNPDAWEVPPGDCDESAGPVSVEKPEPSESKDDGQEEADRRERGEEAPSRRGGGRSASASS
jgi:hypothetical protein